MTRNIPSLFLLAMLAACAPLQPHSSVVGDAGEIVGRVILAPMTLGMSEIILFSEYQSEQQRRQHWAWYQRLTAEQQDREDRRDSATLYGLGLALSGGGPFPNNRIMAAPVPMRSRQSCVGQTLGTATYFDCY